MREKIKIKQNLKKKKEWENDYTREISEREKFGYIREKIFQKMKSILKWTNF